MHGDSSTVARLTDVYSAPSGNQRDEVRKGHLNSEPNVSTEIKTYKDGCHALEVLQPTVASASRGSNIQGFGRAQKPHTCRTHVLMNDAPANRRTHACSIRSTLFTLDLRVACPDRASQPFTNVMIRPV